MSDRSTIEWTDATWGPIKARRLDTGKTGWHCEKVSDGCKFCYSEVFNGRMLPNGGTGLNYSRQSREKVEIFLDQKTLEQPLRWRKPRKVFVCSMTDLFGEFVTDEFIDRVFAVMALCPQHTFQILTKRPERAAEYLNGVDGWEIAEAATSFGRTNNQRWPLPNVWLGTSVENQATADERIPHLLRCPAAVRFLSAEPLLGPVDLTEAMRHYRCDAGAMAAIYHGERMRGVDCGWRGLRHPDDDRPESMRAGKCRCLKAGVDYIFGGVDWVIVGGESGHGARPCNIDWIRSIVEQCREAGTAVFVKQVGANVIDRNDRGFEAETWTWAEGPDAGKPVEPTAWPTPLDVELLDRYQGAPARVRLRDRKGGDIEEWPEDLRVREFPQGEGVGS